MNRIQIRANEFLSLFAVMPSNTQNTRTPKMLWTGHVFRLEPVSSTTTLFAEVSSWLLRDSSWFGFIRWLSHIERDKKLNNTEDGEFNRNRVHD